MKEEELYEDEFRDSISTVDKSGKRIWVYPKKPKGFFHKWRVILSIFLIALLFAAPHIKIGGQPLVLLGILERKFVLFGQVFWPQDLYIFAFTMILMVVFIILFTVVFGRVFCGWICPQTIFMEFVFRKIEYWIEGDWTHQKKLNKQPWNANKIFKKVAKHSLFLLISFLIGNTFLAYIIGADGLWEIQTDPLSAHLGGFIAMIVFSLVFYGVFAFLREQVCTTICPYGRLQGVLLDSDSIIVAYDHVRGETRGRFKKSENRAESGKGDCIDCKQCVHVCPTGIDIRNGTQLECVNCTACIDACDDIMEAVNLPKGLIRYASESNIEGGKKFVFTKRMKSYSALLILLMLIWGLLIGTRTNFQADILKKRGSNYQQLEGGMISNIYELHLINKSNDSYEIELKLEEGLNGEIKLTKSPLHLGPEEHTKNNFIIRMNTKELERGQKKLKVIVLGDGEELLKVRTSFVGPLL
ncbi:cytochrome c oxidase accessory protein CcoG [Brumimicrobium mesophilum]|uniref:cytochrome c oxidase accessory protein CcoG n=1 Tax=Brumimicrobium mesophilum TaxID=392717 RepID=UPI000D144BE6|nr:cytochrome c oxidase accessory protein CcoG [Brumimicrobium mesophilum]